MRYNFITKLEKEQFDKLPQLDRIEFRQKFNRLEENEPNIGYFKFITFMFIAIGFILLLSFSVYNIDSETAIILLSLIPSIFKFGFISVLFLIVLEILLKLVWLKQKKILYNEYFEHKIEVKKKK